MSGSTLYILAGLPGSGKTTLAGGLARHRAAAHIRVDTLEQALRDHFGGVVNSEGYELAYRIAADILRTGVSVIADSCNTIAETRRAWEQVAAAAGARYVNIEIVCSDQREHRHRVETRTSTIMGLRLPTWPEVEAREYEAWRLPHIVVDTAGKSAIESLGELLASLP